MLGVCPKLCKQPAKFRTNPGSLASCGSDKLPATLPTRDPKEAFTMTPEILIRRKNGDEIRVDLSHVPAMDMQEARRWLDEQFTTLDCEPLRPSGKVLLADKVLVVAEAAHNLFADRQWLHTYAAATAAVLGKPFICVDVGTMTVSY